MKLSDSDLLSLRGLILQYIGVNISRENDHVILERLKTFSRKMDFSTYNELYQRLELASEARFTDAFIDAFTINETLFFRDSHPFKLLQSKLIPDIIDQRGSQEALTQDPMQIWCAACSTGQEAYSIAITVKTVLPESTMDKCHIHASDISDNAITRASKGLYSQFEIKRGLSDLQRALYFTENNGEWQVNDELRGLLQFSQANLLKESSTVSPVYDIIFCCNLAIYFSESDRVKLFKSLTNRLRKGGVLVCAMHELAGKYDSRLKCVEHHNMLYYRNIG
jgi:chemotaxis protein methyltransferase CheR